MSRRTLHGWLAALLPVIALCWLAVSAPAAAHKDHKKKQPVAEQVVRPGAQPVMPSAMPQQAATAHAQMGEMVEGMEEDRSQMSFVERLLDWLGRLHPAIVHFPIAFFPAALFIAVIGRRRPAFAAPIRFLVVAGGIIAPIAAVLGWFDAVNAEPSSLLSVHRWLGIAIGVAASGLGVWAWRRPDQVRSAGMIIALATITAAIAVQGWYGGAMVHGIDHMSW